jgi:hypothetical protein
MHLKNIKLLFQWIFLTTTTKGLSQSTYQYQFWISRGEERNFNFPGFIFKKIMFIKES